MGTQHTIPSLLEFVESLNKKKLQPLVTELKEEPSPVSVYYKRSKEDWLRRYPTCGDDIYNELHTLTQEGRGILG
jgi:hypothetical protein